MGPKKEVNKRELETSVVSIDDPINTNNWRCVVVMAVERSSMDSFVLKEFAEEASNGRRREVNLINFEHLILRILDDFANGELPFKYMFLLQFSEIFQEAAEYTKNKLPVPVPLLVRIVKAILLLFRDESMRKIEKKNLGPQDPIKLMADRPANLSVNPSIKLNITKKDPGKTKNVVPGQDTGIKIRPPSLTKEDTKLLKRGERAKEAQCIDDAPLDGFFNLYVLLTGFYQPELPLELIKAQVPLHGLLCIDTSLSHVKRINSSIYGRLQKKTQQPKSLDIKNFWDDFLKLLWSAQESTYFKDVVFQVYTPQRLLCEKKKLKEFIYKEISYLMYDLSDYKRQHMNYLENMKLWDVSENTRFEFTEKLVFELDDLPSECFTVPVILQFIIDAICGEDGREFLDVRSCSYDSIQSDTPISGAAESVFSQSILPMQRSTMLSPPWSQIISDLGDLNTLNVYYKSKELDLQYNLKGKNDFDSNSDQAPTIKEASNTPCCVAKNRMSAENMEDALYYENGIFGSYWKQCDANYNLKNRSFSLQIDYCLYAYLISKVECPNQFHNSFRHNYANDFLEQISTHKMKSSFKLIENLSEEIRKPHFTVTEYSRSVTKSIPFNVKNASRDFFCPRELKLVTPEKVKTSSAPEFHVRPSLVNEMSFISELIVPNEYLDKFEWNVYEDLQKFLGNSVLSNIDGFEIVEELSKPKLLSKETQFWDEYSCVDYAYSVLTDSIFVLLHNKKDLRNTYHEAFNNKLKTSIGLRDFFEYVLEDESEWFAEQEELRRKRLSAIAQLSSQNESLTSYADSFFWLEGSIKHQHFMKLPSMGDLKTGENVKTSPLEAYNEVKIPDEIEKGTKNIYPTPKTHCFEGYNVQDVAVQFSGLKAFYYGNESCMTVELIERLYGKQNLGVHIRQGGHVLHLYSYVCPEPHILQPFTCHLTYKNGIILAFGKRFLEEIRRIREIEDMVDVKKTSKTKRPSLASNVFQKEPQTVVDVKEDNEFAYDLKLSLPNGLMIEVIRKLMKPCYIKQHFLSQSDLTNVERCRLYLPNGDVVKMLRDGKVQVFKVDTSTLSASIDEMIGPSSSVCLSNQEGHKLGTGPSFMRYELITSCGDKFVADRGDVIPTKGTEVFHNTDIQSNKMFFRREDDTDYVINSDGTLCVQFADGTKISSTPFEYVEARKKSMNKSTENSIDPIDAVVSNDVNFELDLVYVYLKVTVEHPDYATVMYNQQTEKWTILLPFESVITVDNQGQYVVKIDSKTELKMERELISMNRFSAGQDLLCSAVADLSVFGKDPPEGAYCKMTSSNGNICVVEPNSNSYILPNKCHELTEKISDEVLRSQATHSDSESPRKTEGESVADEPEKGKNRLDRENKYFVVRKDITGFEVLHIDDAASILTNITKGSVVHTEEFSGPEKLRCFVLISPKPKNIPDQGKWRLDSILPDPQFLPKGKKLLSSSTYGYPPSWIQPFPKRKTKFQVPNSFTCRVFVETRRTNFSPVLGYLDCGFCELLEPSEEIESNSETLKIQEYAKKVSVEDQVLLRQLYIRTARKILNEKKTLRPINSEKLELYLAMVKRHLDLQEYHKSCIRNHLIPNYFDHPSGMSWLLLNNLVENFKFQHPEKQKPKPKEKEILQQVVSPASLISASTFSNEEVEFDVPWSSPRSFSEFSRRSNISCATTPAVFTRADLHPCKITTTRTTLSAPIYEFKDKLQPEEDSPTSQPRICLFRNEDFDEIKKCERVESLNPSKHNLRRLSLKDLISLGLI